ncbi:MAG: hypothetical protein US42_C0001G0019 [Candidatus Magasanikbacteria bacterium GW2011_GWC2_37_14]|uniref:PEGA domain-containing protein n=1 Tax=Candidatus Magasanikbacteria bacterium GW2011_GWC2_37_14 TaxID=1619046 RepID=A0A0G0GAP5_9BACT|nr:MAG: hypothetical protein US42_C0001G0019 [Candidatus Magasanikbacteria bacterium GW2011_GWC2_37_14]
MTYLHTWLTRQVRISIMLSLFAIFFIVSPTVLMYTAGYRFDWATKQLKQTGVISIDILPKDAQIYLNNVLLEESLPIRLPNLAPGTYTVRFSASGYQDWQKEITVESKKTSYLKDITLFKQTTPTKISENDFSNIYFSHNAEYAVTTLNPKNKNEYNYQLNLLNLKNNNNQELLNIESNTQPTISWSTESNLVLIYTFLKNKYNLKIVNPDYANETQNYEFNEPIENWQWSNNSALYIYSNDGIIILNNNTSQEIYNNTSSLWFIDSEEKLWTINNNVLRKNNLAEINLGNNLEIKKIININKDQVLLQLNNEFLAIELNNKELKHNVPAQNIYFNTGTNEWLVYSPWELWSVYQNGTTALLTRTSESMGEILPLDNFGLLLIHSNNKLLGFNPGYYLTHELLKDAEIKELGVNLNLDLRKIFFSGKFADQSGLFSLEY